MKVVDKFVKYCSTQLSSTGTALQGVLTLCTKSREVLSALFLLFALSEECLLLY